MRLKLLQIRFLDHVGELRLPCGRVSTLFFLRLCPEALRFPPPKIFCLPVLFTSEFGVAI